MKRVDLTFAKDESLNSQKWVRVQTEFLVDPHSCQRLLPLSGSRREEMDRTSRAREVTRVRFCHLVSLDLSAETTKCNV